METHVKQVTLDIVHESVRRYISQEDLQYMNIDLDTYLSHLSQDMVVTLTRRRAKEVTDSVTFKHPKTWFQFFKQEHFPKFLLKKFPVKYTTMQVNATAFYDKIALPQQSTEVRLNVLEGQEYLI